MKTARRVTRTAHLLAAAFLLAGCDQPTAPEVVKLVANGATAGSIIKSSVVTTTTYCRGVGECRTSTRNSAIAEKVGRTGLAMVGNSGAGEQSQLPPGALKSMSVSGRTLYADVAKDPNKLWHVELTRDANARGKISGMRLSLNGKLLVVQNTKWKNVGGAWYHEHTDLSFYVNGHVGVHQEKSFSPTAVLPGNPSDQSGATLSLVNDRVSNDVIPLDVVCPEYFPICAWFQAGVNPIPILNGFIGAIGAGIDAASGFLVGVEAGAASNPEITTLAETLQLAMDAIDNPSALNVSLAIGAAADGGWTSTLLEAVVADVIDFILGALAFLGL